MAKVTNIKRIVKEDFEKEDQALIDKLSFVLNPFLEQIASAFNKNIDFDNLNQEVVYLETEVDSAGKPKLNFEIKTNIKTKIKGLACVAGQNLTDTAFPTGCPFITFTTNNNIITIQNITGLPANKRFRLTIILIG